MLTFEDFKPGHFMTLGPRHVSREEIIAFAIEFDPQPMHLDEEAARHSMLRGLAGSRSGNGANWDRSPSPPTTSRNSPRNSTRNAFISTRKRAANRCSAAWRPRAGMSGRSA